MAKPTKQGVKRGSTTTVMTVEGVERPRNKTRYIAGQYYTPDVSVFNIEGVNYRIDSPHIAFDYSKNEYGLRKTMPYYGVVGFDEAIKKPVFGYFSVFKGGPQVLASEDGSITKLFPLLSPVVLPKEYWKEDLVTGDFYPKDFTGAFNSKIAVKSYGKGDLSYSATTDNALFNAIRKDFEKKPLYITELATKLAACINKYSFGIEFETRNGTIPYYKIFENGIVPLKDGSLRRGSIYPYEYTTIPLSGKKGVQAIINTCEDLQKHCSYDVACSMHIHFGNIRLDKLYLLAYYQFARAIQSQIFDLVPHYKTDPVNIANLEKNYCQMLNPLAFKNLNLIPEYFRAGKEAEYRQAIEENYKVLFAFLAGIDVQSVRRTLQPSENRQEHPQGGRKWDRRNRYYYVNLIPAVFDHGTIESRLHQGTFNFDKVIGWMLLNISILNYVEKHTLEILESKSLAKIKLIDIVKEYAVECGNESSWFISRMTAYLKNRKDAMKAAYAKSDTLGKTDRDTDSIPLEGVFMNKDLTASDRAYKNTLMIFNSKAFTLGSTQRWKRNLENAHIDSVVTLHEEVVNLE